MNPITLDTKRTVAPEEILTKILNNYLTYQLGD